MAKILIAEDDLKSRTVLDTVLAKWGYDVVSTGDGIEALEKTKSEEFDLIISDWMMPHSTGIELCETLKERERTQNIPVIMLSIKNSRDDIARAYSAGVADYVTKPFNREDLRTRISNILSPE